MRKPLLGLVMSVVIAIAVYAAQAQQAPAQNTPAQNPPQGQAQGQQPGRGRAGGADPYANNPNAGHDEVSARRAGRQGQRRA